MLFLSDADIAKNITMHETIETVEQAFKEYAKGNVVLPPRSTIMVPKHNGSISFMPSYLTELNAQATKIISIYPDNKSKGLPTTAAWIVVNDPETGMVKAFMDATYLTAMRTGAITGVAAKYLAPKDAKTAAVFGAGVQGKTQTWAACTVRDIEKVYVYDLYPEARKKFAEDMSKQLGIEVIPAESGEEACRDADIVLTATTSPRPVLKREWMKEKVHVSAIGAFYPDWRELDTATVAESKLVIDDREGIEHEAGDILIPIQEGAITWSHIYAELKELVSGKKVGRTPEDTVTVFKSVGIAIQDSSVANLVLRKLDY
ncbi:ornithine cyclodeaminase family protein [Candidatus Bathyarchaeota archaeon]|jgi:alanine dehydrogenase|nr:ornithine cyclodeaminase family protein [Candidatus Bathyarchaeota archaeon]TFH19210.1 MAG: ornithine cyclodeaminase family protein [Candidatus Bathyarchaeota archaeon]